MGDKMREDKNSINIGDKFGMLTAVKYVRSDKNGQKIFLFSCDCGGVKITGGTFAKRGLCKSCGCLPMGVDRFLDNEVLRGRVFSQYKHGAKRRGLDFTIEKNYAIGLSQMNCHYCGSPPSNSMKMYSENRSEEIFTYNGIDRVDNEKGYILGNVVPCCIECNRAKGKMSLRQFMDWIKKVNRWVSIKEAFDNEGEAGIIPFIFPSEVAV
jgi:5-methylcytosine-specific restriction endonuclease McrA